MNMRKVFFMPSLAIDGECIETVRHINCLDDGVLLDATVVESSVNGFRKSAWNPQPITLEIEASVDEFRPYADFWKTLACERTMDIIIKDDRGRKLYIPNAQISQRVKVTGRIPRMMKKHLKRIHGVDWKQYHPNAEKEVNINSK